MAAVQGSANGQNWMGFCYENGKGVSQSGREAFNWYLKAAEHENSKGKEDAEAIRSAQFKVGLFYEQGLVASRDIRQAFDWHRKAAENGCREARSALRSLRLRHPSFWFT